MATTKITSEVLDFNAGRADYSLSATNTVTYVGSSGGNQYVFNGAYGTYGVVNGTYVLSSVSSSHPIAIINNGKTSLISYTGAVNEGTGTGPDGNTYTFYSGNVTITVSGNFDTVSYYCLNHGYMGGKDNLIYIDSVGESGLKMPAGTASNRPTGVTGSMRFDSDITAMEYYNGTDWKEMGTGATGIETTSLSIINTDMIRRNQVAPTDDDYYTLSFWIKPDFPNYSGGGYVFEAGVYASNPREMFFSRTPSSTPGFWLNYDGGASAQDYWSGPFQAPTSDVWQHYCLTKQGGNAPTFYINGVATPTWVSSVAPSLPAGDPGPGTRFNGGTSFNPQTTFNSGQGGSRGIAGEIAHVQFVDGAIVTPTNFVQTVGDFTYPKAYTGSFGNNGFQLLFENASNYQEDTSGNSHTFTTFTYQSAQTSSIYY